LRRALVVGACTGLVFFYDWSQNGNAQEFPLPYPTYKFPVDKLAKPKSDTKPKVVLIACGSFNPITNMHLRLFEMAKDYFEGLGYEVLGGYVSPVSDGYGKKGLQPADHRKEMCKLAVTSSDWIMVDDWEVSFSNWTTTIQVLDYFSQTVNKAVPSSKQKINTVLVCGSDLLDSFNTPGLWAAQDIRDILNKHGIACVSREGTSPESIVWDNDLLYASKEHIHLLRQYIPNDISSTRIRRAISRGMSVKYLVPEPVIDYIIKHKLYRQ